MPNQVTLTFAGDTANAEGAMKRVGGASEQMGSKISSASRDLDEHAGGLKRVGEAADNSERNIIGIHDVIDGTATIMKGPGKQGMVSYIQGWADLAGGIAPIILSLAETKAGIIAQAAASKIAAGASRVWAGAQWLMNSALLASPLTWIVIGIVAVVAAIVLIATKTRWFQDAWRTSWRWIKSAAVDVWNWIRRLPSMIGGAFAGIARLITAPFRTAFNGIANLWNNTVGRLSFSVPSWIPGIGGRSFSAPSLPTFHVGGIVPGVIGAPQLAVLQGGERVESLASRGSGGALVLGSDGSRLGDLLVDVIRIAMGARGGDPASLGIKVKS